MSRTALALLALLVCALAGWLALGGVERGAPALASGESAATTPRSGATPLAAPELVPAAADADAPRRTAALDERPRIAGHVRIAGGIPASETAHIEAELYVGRENEWRVQYAHAEVARDGSFELSVPPDTLYAMVDVQGELLYLDEAVRALPGAEDVVLAPELKARIEGRVLLPAGITTVDWNAVRVSCRESVPSGASAPRSGAELVELLSRTSYTASPEDDGSFALVFLPPGLAFQLEVENPLGPEWSQALAPLRAGERRTVEVALDAGITLAGRVLDERGLPVAGISVSAESPRGELLFPLHHGDETDEAGRFEMPGLARRRWKITANGQELMHGAELVVDAVAGDARELLLAVQRGGRIAGVVVWPDGSPVESFSLTADGDDGEVAFGDFEDGAFEQGTIGDGLYRLAVSGAGAGVVGRGELADVRAGDTGLRVVLEPHAVFDLYGTVLNEKGRGVARFEVRAEGPGHSRKTEGSGDFTLRDLVPGEWRVEVTADDLAPAQQRVVVGPDTPALHFVLAPAGRIRGVVLDARGQPVAGAQVSEEDRGSFFPGGSGPRTDERGRFDVAANALPTRLQAQHEAFAPSEVVELSVASGAAAEGVVLRLREACRLEGRVLDADGRPVVDADVSLQRTGLSATTDVHGGFAFGRLPPGSVSVLARDDAGKASARATAVLTGERTTTLELRLGRVEPVRLRGRVARGGRPCAVPLWFASPAGGAGTQSGEDGRFELTLPSRGDWTCVISLGAAGTQPLPEDVRVLDFVVPDADEHELALDVDAMGRIESLAELAR